MATFTPKNINRNKELKKLEAILNLPNISYESYFTFVSINNSLSKDEIYYLKKTINLYHYLICEKSNLFTFVNPIDLNVLKTKSILERYIIYITQTEFIDDVIDALKYDGFNVIDKEGKIKKLLKEILINAYISRVFNIDTFANILTS